MFNKVCNVIFIVSLIIMLVSFLIYKISNDTNVIAYTISGISAIPCFLFGVILPELFE